MQTTQLRIEERYFARIFRAMCLDDKRAQETVAIHDCEGLIPASTYGEFVERNRDKVQLYEEATWQ